MAMDMSVVSLVAWLITIWVGSILIVVLASIPTSKLSSFHQVILGVAKRGKTPPSSSKLSVPQRFFSHFYMVGAVWTTFWLLTTWLYAYTMSPLMTSLLASHRVWRAVFLLLLMEIQVLRRLFESLYVFHYRPSARMHLFFYLPALCYYILATLSLCWGCAPEVFKFTLSLVSEFIVKEKNQMSAMEIDVWEFVTPLLKLGWLQWIGGAIFLWGWIHQRRCHAILGSLRGPAEQVDEYVIPTGDWFELVSSPHYLAEIVIYVGLVVASGGTDPTVWLLFLFVVANLGFAAAETHKWYLGKFENYPRNRFAMIPFFF